ncbi:MAG: polyprenyl synthetase family protein [Balneolales bacterium]
MNKALESLALPGTPAGLYDPVRYALALGGKRLRPRLLLLTNGLCKGDPEQALPAAVAVELLHNFTLVHDDIMDRAETRRGKPSVYAKWNDASAILSGDVLFVLAIRQLNHFGTLEGDGHPDSSRLISLFLDTIQTVCDGQAMDMEFEERKVVAIHEYMEMIRAKTAALIRCSMEMGAFVAGVDDRTREQCGEIGMHAGLAFQIQDDLLDAIGASEHFGKKVGGDILEGKKTYLSIRAMERADDTDRLLLEEILGNSNAGESDILRVIRIYHDLGVIDDAITRINSHYNQAMEKLSLFEETSYRKEIKALFEKLKVREN